MQNHNDQWRCGQCKEYMQHTQKVVQSQAYNRHMCGRCLQWFQPRYDVVRNNWLEMQRRCQTSVPAGECDLARQKYAYDKYIRALYALRRLRQTNEQLQNDAVAMPTATTTTKTGGGKRKRRTRTQTPFTAF